MYAVDVSPHALAFTAYNAQHAGLGPHVQVLHGSWLEPLRLLQLQGRCGGVLSNPPYIPHEQMAGLQAEVGRHEPGDALDGGQGPGMDSLEVRGGGVCLMRWMEGRGLVWTASRCEVVGCV